MLSKAYTSHIRKITRPYVSLYFLVPCSVRESKRNLFNNIIRTFHICYTKHIQAIFDKSNFVTTPTPVHVFRECCTNIMSTQHTCYTKDIQSVFENSHCIQHTDLSLHFSCFQKTKTTLRTQVVLTTVRERCYTKHIQSILDNSHCMQHRDKSL